MSLYEDLLLGVHMGTRTNNYMGERSVKDFTLLPGYCWTVKAAKLRAWVAC